MLVHGFFQPANSRRVDTMGRIEVELRVRDHNVAALRYLLVNDLAQPRKPVPANRIFDDHKAVAKVTFAVALAE